MRVVRLSLFLLLVTLAAVAQDYTIALVGLRHSHTWNHLTDLLKRTDVRLVGIAENIPELVAEARRLGATQTPYFEDYRKMLDELKPTMVWAFVENNRHLEIVEACAPRKIHVIFEKPLAATYPQAVAIRGTAEKQGIQVMTNFSPAWRPGCYTIKQKAEAGELGAVWRLRATTGHGGMNMGAGRNRVFFEWLSDPEKNGAGALMDFGCYNALYALYFLGRPKSVYASAIHLRPEDFPKVEDNATLILNYDKAVAILESSWDLPPGINALELAGRGGSIKLAGSKVELRKGKDPAQELDPLPLAPERSDPIAYMADCLKNNRRLEGLVSLDYTVGVNEIIDAAKVSIRTGRAAPLPLPDRERN